MATRLVARLPSSRHADVVYSVTIDETGAYRSDCPGFGFHQKCRHVTALAELKSQPIDDGPRCVGTHR
jgi:hypothetical protein